MKEFIKHRSDSNKLALSWPTGRQKLNGYTVNMPRRVQVLLFFIGLAALLVGVRLYDRQSLSGDEPHYLVMTHSIINDHDLNLANDYSRRTYLSYYGDTLDPHVALTELHNSTKQYSIHQPGLAFLLLPVVEFGNQLPPALLMVGVSVLLLYLTFIWVEKQLKNYHIALLTTFVLATSIAFLGLSGYIFPDLITGLLLVSCLLLICPEPTSWSLLGIGLIAGVSAWFHAKNLGIFLPFVIISLIDTWKAKESLIKIAYLLIPYIVLVGLFEVFLYRWYGSFSPTHIYAGQSKFFAVSPLLIVSALLFDAGKGLLTLNPVFFLLIAGLPIWRKTNQSQFNRIIICLLPALLLLATFNEWEAGWSPASRYVTPLLPALAPAIGFLLIKSKDVISKTLQWCVLAGQLVLTLVFVLAKVGWTVVGQRNSLYVSIQNHTSLKLDSLMPSFGSKTILHESWWITLWIVLVIAAWLWGDFLLRNKTILE